MPINYCYISAANYFLLQEHPLLVWPIFIFLLILTFICLPDPQLIPLCPFQFTSAHPIISWTPYPTISPWCHCPIPLLHSWLVTQSPVIFTIVLVCDSTFPLPLPYHWSLTHSLSLTFLCTTTYSLVCACFLYLYKPYIPQLCSLTWIYLVLPSYLVYDLLSLTSLYLWSLNFALTLSYHVLDLWNLCCHPLWLRL
jgi:hypothetical protein